MLAASKFVRRSTLYTTLQSRKRWLILVLLGCAALTIFGCKSTPPLNANGEPVAVHVAYFPNTTHAQAVVGMARGDFQNAVGTETQVVPHTFNAGTVVIEALYAGHIDLAYVGPSPALNGFLQSGGEEVRVIAGAARNGVSILGNKARGITTIGQLNGGKVATPQFANTQDISARYFLGVQMGFNITNTGKGTRIIPIANPDIEMLFAKDELDGAWVPEPWASRLVHRGLANELAREHELWPDSTFSMTCVVARREFVEAHPALVQRFLSAHIALTEELQSDKMAHADLINDEIERITARALETEVLRKSLEKTDFAFEPHRESFLRYFEMGRAVDIYRQEEFDVERLLYTGPLEAAQTSNSPAQAPDSPTTNTIATRTEGQTP